MVRSGCVLLCLFLMPIYVVSCSCVEQNTRQKFRAAQSVFLGTVIDTSPAHFAGELSTFFDLVRFRVDRQWKGNKKKEITLAAQYDVPGMCNDLPIDKGQQILVYATKREGQLVLYRECGPNLPAKSAGDEIKQLDSFWFRLYARVFPFPTI